MFRSLTTPMLAALLAFGTIRPALADSWPTSFEFNQGVKLTVTGADGRKQTKELKPYRGASYTEAEARNVVKAALSAIGNKSTTLGEVYGIVQVVDSMAMNAGPGGWYDGKGAKSVLGSFKSGLKQLAEAGDGANAQLGLAVHTIYSKLRTAQSVKDTQNAWSESSKGYSARRELRQLQKVVKDPAIDLIVATLRNDVAAQLSDPQKPANMKKAQDMFFKSERDFTKAASKVLLQGAATTPSTASLHTRHGLKAFADYAKYFEKEMPSVGRVNRMLEAKGVQNVSKIAMLQAISNVRAKEVGRRPTRMPGFQGNLSLLPRAPAPRR